MLYFIESGMYAKIGYSKDESTLRSRIESYQTHNPSFRLIDIAEGTLEDEKKLQALYRKYLVNNTSEWCYAKKQVTNIWVAYRTSREKIDYYNEFGLRDKGTTFGRVNINPDSIRAFKEGLITEDEVDLFDEFERYYN